MDFLVPPLNGSVGPTAHGHNCHLDSMVLNIAIATDLLAAWREHELPSASGFSSCCGGNGGVYSIVGSSSN